MTAAPGVATARAFRWYAAGVTAWFVAWGVTSLSLSWLVVGVLHEPDRRVGIAQTALQLPTLLLLPAGGALADRVEPRRLLAGMQLVLVAPVLALGLAAGGARLGYAGVIAFAIAWGLASALVMPARDALLSRVAGGDMMRAVTTLTVCQFGGQALGTLLGGGAAKVHGALPFALEALVLAFAALAMARVPAGAAHARASGQAGAASGLAAVARTPSLRIPIALVSAVGVFFMGAFSVCFPLLVDRRYHGGPGDLSLVMMMFPLGTIAGSLAIRARGGIERKGRAMLIALGTGAALEGAMSAGLPFALLVALTFAWGLAGSVFITSSRTLVQECAPADRRGRVLAAYSLGFMGSGALGALGVGALSEAFGPLATLRLCAGAMACAVVSAAAVSGAWRLRSPAAEGALR